MKIPSGIAELLDLGQQNLAGLVKLGATLDILQYTPANFQPLVDNLQSRQDDFNAARTATATATASAVVGTQVAAMDKAIGDARHVLCISWGDFWTPDWTQAGWNANTTAVPQPATELAELCAAIGAFLGNAANVDYVVNTPKVNFTAARYEGFVGTTGTFTGTESALATARSTQGQRLDDRVGDADALRHAIQGLIAILNGKLGPMDPRWDEFGLPRPGAKSLPGVPTGLALSKTGTTAVTVLAQCDPTPTATYYRWFAKLEGVDPNFRFLKRTKDPLFQLTDQPAAGHLDMKVEAANEAGPGKASAAVGIALG